MTLDEAMGIMDYNKTLRERVIGKLIVDEAKNLSDAELTRVLGNCCGPWILPFAQVLRDNGIITESDIIWEKCIIAPETDCDYWEENLGELENRIKTMTLTEIERRKKG